MIIVVMMMIIIIIIRYVSRIYLEDVCPRCQVADAGVFRRKPVVFLYGFIPEYVDGQNWGPL